MWHYKSILQHHNSQDVTGVRFQFAFRGGGDSTAMNANGTVNSTWLAKLLLFFQDIKASGINEVAITPNFYGWENDGAQIQQVFDSCTGIYRNLRFWPAAPFGVNPSNGQPWEGGRNDSYNCAPANPIFIGWSNIYNLIDQVLQAARDANLTVTELDVQNEVNLQWFTVYARLIRDNKHGSSGNPDVLDVLRWYMAKDRSGVSFDPDKVTWSVALPRVQSAGYDCGSVYGDSARIYELSALVSAIAGGAVGHPSNWTVVNNLGCGGTATGMVGTGVYHTQPDILDTHMYPCVIQTSGSLDCDLSKNSFLKDEAKLTFNGIRAFMDSFGPSGWRQYDPQVFQAKFILGETHSNTNNGGISCENAPLTAPADTVTGFNQSALGGSTTAVFRPWENSRGSCFPLLPVINPPYEP